MDARTRRAIEALARWHEAARRLQRDQPRPYRIVSMEDHYDQTPEGGPVNPVAELWAAWAAARASDAAVDPGDL